MPPVEASDSNIGFRRRLGGLAVLTFVSRLPFLSSGYGTDPDSWRMVGAGLEMAQTHVYRASRLPGYPVLEWTAAGLGALSSPFRLNALSALFSTLAVVALGAAGRRLGVRRPLTVAALVGFTPVVFVNSTVFMDYLWALGFASAALWAVSAQRPLAAGLLLGAGMGCRLTTGAWGLPLIFLLRPFDTP